MDNMNIAQNTAITEYLLEITDKTTLEELLITLGLEPGQKRKGKTPTRAKLIASAEPFVKMRNITLYNSALHFMRTALADTLSSGFRTV